MALRLLVSLSSSLSKKEGNNWRTICEGTVTRQDEKRMRSVSGPEKSIRDAIPYSALSEFARWRASSPSYRFRRSPCLCRSSLSEPVCSLSFHFSFIPFFSLPIQNLFHLLYSQTLTLDLVKTFQFRGGYRGGTKTSDHKPGCQIGHDGGLKDTGARSHSQR